MAVDYLIPGNFYRTSDDTFVTLEYDEFPESPRDWATTTFVLLNSSYSQPDGVTVEEFLKDLDLDRPLEEYNTDQLMSAAKKHGIIMEPVSVYEHSGTEFYLGYPQDHYDGRWDCSFAGFMYVSITALAQVFPETPAGALESKAKQLFGGDLAVYNQFVNGDVYVWTEYEKTGEPYNCYGGLYGTSSRDLDVDIVENLGHFKNIDDCLLKAGWSAYDLKSELEEIQSVMDAISHDSHVCQILKGQESLLENELERRKRDRQVID